MKKAFRTVLYFAVVMAVLVVIGMLWQKYRPAQEPEEAAEEVTVQADTGELDSETAEISAKGATVIEFRGNSAYTSGYGARYSDGAVTIAYPGVYAVSGTLDDGQLIVDLGDYSGTVYLLLQGADVSCSDGPALQVVQAEETVLVTEAGTVNTFTDGADYWIDEQGVYNQGAAIYSADDLVLRGEGTLTVTGNAADGIRCKDGLTVSSGTLNVTAAQDALQGSDYVRVHGGTVTLTAENDAIATTEGDVVITAGSVSAEAAGDGIAAAGDVNVEAGTLTVRTAGGYDAYREAALDEISAKGIKGQTVTVSGGTLSLNCADDALHGVNVSVTGGILSVCSGDDALSADETLRLDGGTINIITSYEAAEADSIIMTDGVLTAIAENNGLSGGDGSFLMYGGTADVTAEEALNATAARVYGGTLVLRTEDILSLDSAAVTGGTLVCLSNSECENSALSGAVQYLYENAVPANTALCLQDETGAAVVSVQTDAQYTAVLVVSGMFRPGGSYTLTGPAEELTAVSGDGLQTVGQLAQASNEMQGGMPGRP